MLIGWLSECGRRMQLKELLTLTTTPVNAGFLLNAVSKPLPEKPTVFSSSDKSKVNSGCFVVIVKSFLFVFAW